MSRHGPTLPVLHEPAAAKAKTMACATIALCCPQIRMKSPPSRIRRRRKTRSIWGAGGHGRLLMTNHQARGAQYFPPNGLAMRTAPFLRGAASARACGQGAIWRGQPERHPTRKWHLWPQLRWIGPWRGSAKLQHTALMQVAARCILCRGASHRGTEPCQSWSRCSPLPSWW